MLGFLARRSPPPAAPERRDPLPPDLLRKVRRIEIATRRLIDQGVAGDYHSAFKGRGVEFAEVRPYVPGDDVRTIDWNVTARFETPYVKRYIEERDLTVFLGVDVSGSLGYGSRRILKRELAAEISALLAFAALSNQDRVGAALLGDGLELFLRPDRRRTHVLRMVREILMRPPSRVSELDRGIWSILRSLKKRSVLFLISDFLAPLPSGALKAASARHDVVVLEIVDPHDAAPPAAGPVVLRDAENGHVEIHGGRAWASRITAERGAAREELRALLRRLRVDHLEIRTDRPYLDPMVRFFELRRRRMAR